MLNFIDVTKMLYSFLKENILTWYFLCHRNDAKTVNVITTACFSKVTKVSFFQSDSLLNDKFINGKTIHHCLCLLVFRSLLQVLNSSWVKMKMKRTRVIPNQRQVPKIKCLKAEYLYPNTSFSHKVLYMQQN